MADYRDENSDENSDDNSDDIASSPRVSPTRGAIHPSPCPSHYRLSRIVEQFHIVELFLDIMLR